MSDKTSVNLESKYTIYIVPCTQVLGLEPKQHRPFRHKTKLHPFSSLAELVGLGSGAIQALATRGKERCRLIQQEVNTEVEEAHYSRMVGM